MIEITYYDDAIYVLNNTQYFEVESDIDYEEDTTFRIRTDSIRTTPCMLWDHLTYEGYDGDETEYDFIEVTIPFGWTGKIPIRDRDKQELCFNVIENSWLTFVEPERVHLCE